MTIVDFSSLEKYVSNMENRGERLRLLSLAQSKPYQVINDSPTVKHYTDWSEFDRLNLTIYPLSNQIRKYIEDEYKVINIVNDSIEGSSFSYDVNNSLIKTDEGKLVALTLAISKKIKIKIGKSDNEKNRKILIYHTVSEKNYISPAHIEIETDEGTEADIIYLAENKVSSSMLSSVMSVKVSKGSRVNLALVSRSSYIYNYTKVYSEGEINTTIFATKSRMTHIEYTTVLDNAARSIFNAKAVGTNDDKIDLKVNVYHEGERSVSEGNLKGIATENAYVVVRGDAVVDDRAYDSSTSIIGRAYILGKNAKAIASPMLEVRTGKVTMAKHSASVSRVPDELIFYLQNRGFNRKEAEMYLIRAFIEDEQDPEILKKIIEETLTESKIIVSV